MKTRRLVGLCEKVAALVFFVLFLTNVEAAAGSWPGSGGLELRAEIKNNVLTVYIKNNTEKKVMINRSFSMDQVLGVLSLKISKNGHVLHVKGQIDGNVSDKHSYVDLYPGQLYGQDIDIWYIKMLYGINVGCYSLQASYLDKYAFRYRAYGGILSSNKVTLCINVSDKSNKEKSS